MNMLPSEISVEIGGLREQPPEPCVVSLSGRSDQRARDFAALSKTTLASRFVSWQGLSGKTYVFSVFAASHCPAFCDAVMLAVVRDIRGEPRALSAFETAAFPEPVLARVRRELGLVYESLEFHAHLLAHGASERRAAIADLEARFDEHAALRLTRLRLYGARL